MEEVDPIRVLSDRVAAAGSIRALARELQHKNDNYLRQVLAGAKPPSDKLLRALGLVRVIVRADGAAHEA